MNSRRAMSAIADQTGRGEDDPLFVARDAAFLAAIAVVLDDHDGLSLGQPGFRRGRHGRRNSSGAPKSTVLALLAHCSTSPVWSSMPSLSAKSLRSCPEAKWALRKVMVTGVSGVELLQHLLEERLDEGRVDLDFADHDLDGSALPCPTVRATFFEGGGLLGGLLQPLERLGARVELAAGARDEPPGLDVVNLHALLALGREAELGLGFEASRPRRKTRSSTSPSPMSTGLSYGVPSRGSLPSSV